MPHQPDNHHLCRVGSRSLQSYASAKNTRIGAFVALLMTMQSHRRARDCVHNASGRPSAISRTTSRRPLTRTCAPEHTPNVQ